MGILRENCRKERVALFVIGNYFLLDYFYYSESFGNYVEASAASLCLAKADILRK